MPRNVAIQILRGMASNIPVLEDGEFYFATNIGQLYVGLGGINWTLGTPVMAAVTIQGSINPTRFIEPNADGSIQVEGIFWQSVQPVSGTIAISNFPVTQPVSGTIAVSNFPATQPVSIAATVPVSVAATVPVQEVAAVLGVTAVGASGAAVTLTLPAVAAQFHYITFIEIVKYAAAALTGAATPVTVTTTNLPGTPAFTFTTAGAIGTSERDIYNPNKAIKAAAVNTATTIVCPATTGVIWRVNVWYVAAP